MKNLKLIIVFIMGFILAIGIGSAYKLNANEVTYDKKNSTLESEQVQGALDELGVLAITKINSLEEKINNLNSDSTIRYNEENDYIQIKSNGAWVNWKFVDSKGIYIYKNGNLLGDIVVYREPTYFTYSVGKDYIQFHKSASATSSGFGFDYSLVNYIGKGKKLVISYYFADSTTTPNAAVRLYTASQLTTENYTNEIDTYVFNDTSIHTVTYDIDNYFSVNKPYMEFWFNYPNDNQKITDFRITDIHIRD